MKHAAFAASLLLFAALACNAPAASSGTATSPVATRTASPTATTAQPSALSPGSSTRAPAEVLGSVLIEHGRSASGGTAGSTIQVEVDVTATSTVGKVTEMRLAPVGSCENSGQVETAPWEPFTPKKSLTTTLALNWVGFYVAAQFRDDKGNTSLIYCDDISLEGQPPQPSITSTGWYSQIQCFSETDVHPSQGETVAGPTVTFRWPATNQLPDGVFYQVNAYSSVDQYAGLVAQGRTRDTSLALQIPPDKAGDIVWYVTLSDTNGTFLDHGRCSSFPASLLTVDPPSGIKGVHFTYKP